MTARTTMMFDIDISTIDINPLQIDTPFGRAGTIARGDLFAERDALEARVAELENGLVNILDGQKTKAAILDIAFDALNTIPPKETP